jgi:ankyrin repeat protein
VIAGTRELDSFAPHARGHVESVRMLLDRGADRFSPFHFSASEGHLQVAEALLGHGVDLYVRNEKGQMPARVASDGVTVN